MKIGYYFRLSLFLLTLLVQASCSFEPVLERNKLVLHSSEPVGLLGELGNINSFDLFVDEAQITHLAVDTGDARYYLQSENGGIDWTAPQQVAQGKSNSRLGNDIQIATSGGRLLVLWKGVGELPGWGVAELRVSDDQGLSWQKVESPAKGDWLKNQGYFSLVANQQGFHLFWLDDREEAGNTQGLRYASSNNGLIWSGDETLETGLCTCCWISSALTGERLHALYRGEGPRDMRTITLDIQNRQWKPSVRVGEFDWDFVGCPHQGGALTESLDGNLHSIVWTGKEALAGLHYLKSNDQGDSWVYQQPLSGGEGQHADIASLSGKVLAVWDSQSIQGSEIQLMILGSRNDSVMKLSMKSNGFAYPRVISSRNNFRLFWTDLDKMGKKRLKTVEIKQAKQKVKR